MLRVNSVNGSSHYVFYHAVSIDSPFSKWISIFSLVSLATNSRMWANIIMIFPISFQLSSEKCSWWLVEPLYGWSKDMWKLIGAELDLRLGSMHACRLALRKRWHFALPLYWSISLELLFEYCCNFVWEIYKGVAFIRGWVRESCAFVSGALYDRILGADCFHFVGTHTSSRSIRRHHSTQKILQRGEQRQIVRILWMRELSRLRLKTRSRMSFPLTICSTPYNWNIYRYRWCWKRSILYVVSRCKKVNWKRVRRPLCVCMRNFWTRIVLDCIICSRFSQHVDCRETIQFGVTKRRNVISIARILYACSINILDMHCFF